MALVSLIVAIILNSVALLFVKHSVAAVADMLDPFDSLAFFVETVTHPSFLLGGCSFIAAVGAWILALRRIELSLAYPSTSASYALIAVASYLFFDESLTINRVFGIGLIVVGVAIMNSPSASVPGFEE